MAEQLQQFQSPPAQEGIQFNPEQYFSTMQQVMQNPQFMSMAERLGSTLMQVFNLFLVDWKFETTAC